MFTIEILTVWKALQAVEKHWIHCNNYYIS